MNPTHLVHSGKKKKKAGKRFNLSVRLSYSATFAHIMSFLFQKQKRRIGQFGSILLTGKGEKIFEVSLNS